MTHDEAKQFLDHLEKLWPRWEKSEEQVRLIGAAVRSADFKVAVGASNTVWVGQSRRTVEPPVNAIRTEIRAQSPVVKKTASGSTGRAYALRKVDDSGTQVAPDIEFWWVRNQPSPERAMEWAREMCVKHEQLYGGKWIVIQRDLDPVLPQEPAEGSRDDAEALIACGDDTPGRRFLEQVLLRREKTKGRTPAADNPVAVQDKEATGRDLAREFAETYRL